MDQTWTQYLPAFLKNKVEGRQALQKAISNTGWLLADNILRMGIGLFVGVWVARYLGPEKFGQLNYALAFVTLSLPIVTLGLDEIVVRNIVHDPRCANETMGTAFVLKLAGGLVAFTAATTAVIVLRPTDTLSHWLVAIIAAGNLFHAFYVVDLWFNSQLQSKYGAIARNAAFLICAAIKVVLIMKGAPLIVFAVLCTLEIALCAVVLVLVYRLKGGNIRQWKTSRDYAKKLLKDSWPLIISFISIGIYQRIDQVLLQEMVGSTEVGLYAVAVRMVEVWTFVPTAIYWSVFPGIVEAKKVSDELFYQQIQKFYNLVVFLSYAVAIPTTLFSQLLINTLYGQAYGRAGLMLAALIWVHLFTSLEIARCAFLTSMNWNRLYFLTVFLGCLLNIVLCYLLIPRYGGMGAVAASIISYWFAAHGSCFMFKDLYKTGFMLSRALLYPRIW